MHAPLNRDALVADAVEALQARWLPQLIACWRATTRSAGPASALKPAEVSQVAAAVRALSSGLIREREAIGTDYMSDPASLGAYLLYFWPVSYVQARVFLAQTVHATGRPLGRVLELGAGPGPMGLAALDLGADSLDACERSAAALAALERLAAGQRAPVATRRVDLHETPEALPVGPFNTILMGHALNELWADEPAPPEVRARWVAEVLGERLERDGALVIIEPALRETSRAALEVRDALVARGWPVAAPCLWAGACPALIRPQDWCHAEVGWEPPQLVAEIARAAGLRKESLKYTPLALRRPDAPAHRVPDAPAEAPRLFHIVSEPLHIKGKLRHVGCGPEGRHTLTLLTKLVNERNAIFAELERGDTVAISETSEKGDGLSLSGGPVIKLG